eukprot:6196065-Pleurochrysis_carterae.AAC.2
MSEQQAKVRSAPDTWNGTQWPSVARVADPIGCNGGSLDALQRASAAQAATGRIGRGPWPVAPVWEHYVDTR